MKIHIPVLLVVMLLAGMSNCNKKLDEPPEHSGPLIHENLSVRQLREMHLAGGFEKIMSEYVIAGQVVANDSSDNLYKTIVLQDSTAGITIRMDGIGLYNQYHVGRKIYVKLKDLWLGDYAGMLQLGAGVDRSDPQYPELVSIPQPLFARYIVPGPQLAPRQPRPVRIDELADSLQSCLVVLGGMELPAQDTGKTFADAVNRLSANRTLQDCSGSRISLRTSGFARFAGIRTPRGNGSVTGIYSVFRNEKQLLLRDTGDIRLNGLRCAAGGVKTLLSEDFEMASTDPAQPARNWRCIPETGGRFFEQKTSQGNGFAEVNAFASGQASVVSWLISPAIDLTGSANEVLSFVTKDGFDNGATLQVLVSTNYDGGSTPWKARWTPLKAVVSKGAVNTLAPGWLSSGNISLDNYNGTVHIAFRYEGADPVNPVDKRTTRFQVDRVRVMGN